MIGHVIDGWILLIGLFGLGLIVAITAARGLAQRAARLPRTAPLHMPCSWRGVSLSDPARQDQKVVESEPPPHLSSPGKRGS